MIARRISELRAAPSWANGLRARDLFLGAASESEPSALIDSYTNGLKPQSTAEQLAIKSLGTPEWRQAWTEPANLLALAFRSLSDGSCVLDLIHRFESQAWSELEAELTEKLNINERTPEAIENAWLPTTMFLQKGGAREGNSGDNTRCKKRKLTNEPNNPLKISHRRPAATAKRTQRDCG